MVLATIQCLHQFVNHFVQIGLLSKSDPEIDLENWQSLQGAKESPTK